MLNGHAHFATLDARFGGEANPTREGDFTIYQYQWQRFLARAFQEAFDLSVLRKHQRLLCQIKTFDHRTVLLGPIHVSGKIHQLLIDSVGGDGRLLDVGCGSGQLLIRFAKSVPGDYVGLDYWGSDWEFSRAQAERNAVLEKASGLQFLRGSASKLPFRDDHFGRIVSSLTFHEVQDVKDKTASIAEAMRVLEPGGRFAFIDLFDDPKFYGGRQTVLDVITSHGGRIDTASSLSEVLDLRFPLNLAKVLKYAVFVSGVKPLQMEQQEARSAAG